MSDASDGTNTGEARGQTGKPKILLYLLALLLAVAYGGHTWFGQQRSRQPSRPNPYGHAAVDAEALVRRAFYSNDPAVSRELYAEVIRNYDSIPDSWVQNFVVLSRFNTALLSDDDGEKKHLLDAIITTHKGKVNINDRISVHVFRAMVMRTEFMEKPEEKIRMLDEAIALFSGSGIIDNQISQVRAYANKGRALAESDPAKGIKVIENGIAPHRDNGHPDMQLIVAQCLNEMANLSRTPAQRLRLYDEVIAAYGENDSLPIRHQVALAMYLRAYCVSSGQERIAAYEALIDRFQDDEDEVLQQFVANSVGYKTSLLRNTSKRPF